MASSCTKKDGFLKKCLNHSITLLQQSSDKRDAQLFRYFGYKKSIEKFQIYQKRRAFHLNKAHYLKPYIGSSVYRDQKLQCVEEYKYTFNQVRSRSDVFQSKFVRLVYRSHGIVESNRVL